MLEAVSGNAEPKNIEGDLFHVFEAHKNGGGHFVTRDKRLLKRSGMIGELLQIEVLTPDDFVEKIAQAKARQVEFDRARGRDA